MLKTRCTIARKETMTDNNVLDQLMRIRYDLTAAQGKLTDAMETIAALNLSGARRPRAGSPRELHPDACPHCELAGGHTADCPTQPQDTQRRLTDEEMTRIELARRDYETEPIV